MYLKNEARSGRVSDLIRLNKLFWPKIYEETQKEHVEVLNWSQKTISNKLQALGKVQNLETSLT